MYLLLFLVGLATLTVYSHGLRNLAFASSSEDGDGRAQEEGEGGASWEKQQQEPEEVPGIELPLRVHEDLLTGRRTATFTIPNEEDDEPSEDDESSEDEQGTDGQGTDEEET